MNKFWNYLKYTLAQTKIYGTVFSILATILGVGGFDSLLPTISSKVTGVLIFLIFSYIIALLWTVQISKVIISIGNNKNISIEFGDLFDGQSVIIPVNRYFDTLVNEDVISRNSIAGQFIEKYFPGNVVELNTLIDQKLSTLSPELTTKTLGKNKAYPIGTIVVLNHSGKNFYLIASTDVDLTTNSTCSCNDEILGCSIRSLLNSLNHNANMDDVYMPVIGTGLSRMQKDVKTVLEYIISVIKMSEIPWRCHIHIIIRKKDKGNINLLEFK
ncbi:hypothetical protein FACS189499_09840 [Clostridia bacterium]|nr:hypothetical protein FACS189499_09840 [Clostridia bacterium]